MSLPCSFCTWYIAYPEENSVRGTRMQPFQCAGHLETKSSPDPPKYSQCSNLRYTGSVTGLVWKSPSPNVNQQMEGILIPSEGDKSG